MALTHRLSVPRNDEDRSMAFAFLREHGAEIPEFDDVRFLVHRNTDGTVNAVLAFHRWCQRTASMSIAAHADEHWLDRTMLAAAIDYAFRVCALAALHVQISSSNRSALCAAQHAGFRPVHFVPHGWSDDSDLVMMEIRLADVVKKEDLH